MFRRITQTDSYGLASTEFGLADEVNLGTYHLRAVLENAAEGTQSQTEIALQVERYVLPKFKVAVELSGKENGNKRGYRPGGHVTGTVRANYFSENQWMPQRSGEGIRHGRCAIRCRDFSRANG